jgi:hypothetical protein
VSFISRSVPIAVGTRSRLRVSASGASVDHGEVDDQPAEGGDVESHGVIDGEATALAPVYREALRLQAAGHDHAAIGAALDVHVQAVPALLVLAQRKQDRASGATQES